MTFWSSPIYHNYVMSFGRTNLANPSPSMVRCLPANRAPLDVSQKVDVASLLIRGGRVSAPTKKMWTAPFSKRILGNSSLNSVLKFAVYKQPLIHLNAHDPPLPFATIIYNEFISIPVVCDKGCGDIIRYCGAIESKNNPSSYWRGGNTVFTNQQLSLVKVRHIWNATHNIYIGFIYIGPLLYQLLTNIMRGLRRELLI
jgi:hypothetical protein